MNVTAESQGRLQVARLYNMTDDNGVRDLLKFLLARDTMHQNQWLAAIAELRADGLEGTPCPSNFPQEQEHTRYSYQFINCSSGTESADGRWAKGDSIDGKGRFEYVANPQPAGGIPDLDGGADPRWYGTSKRPMQATANA
jgi:Mn-containing catalase